MGFVYRGKVVDSPGQARLVKGSSGKALAKTLSAPSSASSFVGKRGPVDSETQPG